MEQSAILTLVFLPVAGFWLMLLFEWSPTDGLKGNTLKIVDWLIGYTIQIASSIALVLCVLAFVLSLAAFFGFSVLKEKGLMPWYFGIFFVLIISQGVILFLAKLFLLQGRRKNLIK